MNPLLAPLLDLGKMLIARFIPDPAEQAKAQLELLRMSQEGDLKQILAQLEINAKEAQSASLFVAGWRPFIGWVCGCALAYQYLLKPILMAAFTYFGVGIVLPGLDDMLWQLMFGMLGMGGLRTLEKVKKVSGK